MNDTHVHAVILANGSNERLWPLSRKKRPKQLLPFIKESSLLQQAIDRASRLVPFENRWIITNQECADEFDETIINTVKNIVVEPEYRDTAAAVTLACMMIQENDSQAVMIVIPSDQYIPHITTCVEFMEHAIDYAKHNEKIVILGIKPTYTSTQYSYIAYNQDGVYPAPIQGFDEHPSKENIQDYIEVGALWNTGIYAAQVSFFLDTCQKKSPALFAHVAHFVHSYGEYTDVPTETVDSIFAKSDVCAVLPVDFVWSDIGNIDIFLSLAGSQSDEQNVIEIDSNNNIVEAQDSLVALVGVDNVCVIQKDDILLIIDRDQIEKVKMVVDILKKNHSDQYL